MGRKDKSGHFPALPTLEYRETFLRMGLSSDPVPKTDIPGTYRTQQFLNIKQEVIIKTQSVTHIQLLLTQNEVYNSIWKAIGI
jgi:hypothetical protein